MWPLSSKMALAEGLGQVTWTLQLISSSVNGDNNSYLACFLELLRGWSVIRNMKLCWNLWSARYARYIVHGGYCSKHKYTCHERLSWFPNSFSGCSPRSLLNNDQNLIISVLLHYLQHRSQRNYLPHKRELAMKILKCHSIPNHWSKQRMKYPTNDGPE